MHVGFFFCLEEVVSVHERTGLRCPASTENLPELQACVYSKIPKAGSLESGLSFLDTS